MERKAKMEATPADLTKPLDPKHVQSQLVQQDTNGDCFTKLWSPKAPECATCADNEVCSIYFAQRLKGKVIERQEAEGTKPLDISELSSLNMQEVYEEISVRIKYGAKMSVDDFYDYLSKQGRTDDEVAIVEWIKRFIKHYSPAVKIVNSYLVVA